MPTVLRASGLRPTQLSGSEWTPEVPARGQQRAVSWSNSGQKCNIRHRIQPCPLLPYVEHLHLVEKYTGSPGRERELGTGVGSYKRGCRLVSLTIPMGGFQGMKEAVARHEPRQLLTGRTGPGRGCGDGPPCGGFLGPLQAKPQRQRAEWRLPEAGGFGGKWGGRLIRMKFLWGMMTVFYHCCREGCPTLQTH